MNEEKLARVKTVAKFVAVRSVHFVVAGTLSSLVPKENRRERVQAFVGSYVISGMVARHTATFVNHEIDEALETYQELKDWFFGEVQTKDDDGVKEPPQESDEV